MNKSRRSLFLALKRGGKWEERDVQRDIPRDTHHLAEFV